MRGFTLVEALVVLLVASLCFTIALPALAYVRQEGRAAAGALELATKLRALRFESVARRRARGLLFGRQDGVWVYWVVEDGNGNDLRTAEVRSGVDPIRSGPHRLQDPALGARLGFPPGLSIPQIPPKPGTITGLDDPVQFGATDLVSFTPSGSASSGTLYVTDGQSALYGIVLYGPTAKLRIWRYDARKRRWSS